MPLSSSKKDEILQHLRSKVNGPCPMCGQGNRGLDENLSFLGILDPEYKQPVAGGLFPVVVVTCANCHYVSLFAAMPLHAV
ncbi:MAG: hypothetical protein L0216_00035 [Planctomycetales bacterium]|nr:hypothetical protein [Planctomycetales bacterium]